MEQIQEQQPRQPVGGRDSKQQAAGSRQQAADSKQNISTAEQQNSRILAQHHSTTARQRM